MVENSQDSQRSLARRLGRNVASRRKALGWTQAALAERLGIEPESVSRCERGVTVPSLLLLEQIALVLQTTVAELLAECPAEAYSEAERLSALLSRVPAEKRTVLIQIVEKFCDLLDPERGSKGGNGGGDRESP